MTLGVGWRRATSTLRLARWGLSPKSDPVTDLLPDDRYRVAEARYLGLAELAEGREVLEIGCGTGFGCELLAEAGAASVLGLEAFPRPIRFARRRHGRGGARFEVMALEPPFDLPPGQLDLIVAFQWLQRGLDVEAKVTELARLVRPGGRVAIAVPLMRNREELAAAMARQPEDTHLFPWYWEGILRVGLRGEVRCYRHEPPPGVRVDWAERKPSALRSGDFRLTELDGPEQLAWEPSLAALFVASRGPDSGSEEAA